MLEANNIVNMININVNPAFEGMLAATGILRKIPNNCKAKLNLIDAFSPYFPGNVTIPVFLSPSRSVTSISSSRPIINTILEITIIKYSGG